MLKKIELNEVTKEIKRACKRIISIKGTYKGLYYIIEDNKYNYTFDFICLKIEKKINNYTYSIDGLLVNEKRAKQELKKQCNLFGEEIIDAKKLTYLLKRLNIKFTKRKDKVTVKKEDLNEKINLINNFKNF